MRKRKQKQKEAKPFNRLSLEYLESRMLLAGNVVAEVSGDVLILTGDAYDNSVQVSTFYDSEYGWGFKVEGHDKDGPTTINGGNCEEFFAPNLKVLLDGGNDDFVLTNNLDHLLYCLDCSQEPEASPEFFEVEEFKVVGWVFVNMGDGSNFVGVGPGEVCGRVQIQGGSGCDEVDICETRIGGNLVIQTFGGDDEVSIHDSKTEGITRVLTANGCSEVEIEEYCTQNLVVRGGNHHDDVFIACVTIHEDLVIQTLNGRDSVLIDECCERDEYENSEPANELEEECCCEYDNYIGDSVIIQTGDGDSCVGVFSVSANQIFITGGIDEDKIDVECVETYLNLRINTLDGCDEVNVGDVSVLSLIITTGLGDDEVEIYSDRCGNYFEEDLVVRTDGGDDCVIIGNEIFTIFSESEGGGDNKSFVGDDLVVETGDGTDYIKVFNYCIGEDMVVNAGAGDDRGFGYGDASIESSEGDCCGGGVDICEVEVGRHLTVLLGDGSDSASINDVCVEGNAVVDAGAGDDGGFGEWDVDNFNGGGAGVSIRDLFVRQNFYMYLGEGHDRANLCDVEVCGSAFLHGGLDCDHIKLDDVDVHNDLFVFMGGGDDKLSVEDSSADVARFYGDGGYDVLCEDSNSFGSRFVYTFEETNL